MFGSSFEADLLEVWYLKEKPKLGLPGAFTVSFPGEGSPANIDHGKKGTLILSSLLEDLEKDNQKHCFCCSLKRREPPM